MLSTAQQDTIVAVATPPGRGGIGIVRLSGPRARIIVAPLLRLRHPLAPMQAQFGYLLDLSRGSGSDILDEVVVTFFAAPHSYTSEDVLEISSHGSPVVLEYLLRECMARGSRLAEPGEFTQRAFLAGRLDLTQAEAIHDLIEATTLHQARLAASQLGGSLSRQVAPVKTGLLRLIANLEAGIDFAEDDVDVLGTQEVLDQIAAVRAPLISLERSFLDGRLIHQGCSLAIVGRPNAGKSSLFNALLGTSRAIVTAHPGTTRDLVTERFSLKGIPLELIDTAGIRSLRAETQSSVCLPLDEAERLGITKSREAVADADLIMLVVDTTQPLHYDDLAILAQRVNRPLLIACNKCDLLTQTSADTLTRDLKRSFGTSEEVRSALGEALNSRSPAIRWPVVQVSGLTGEGLQALRDAISAIITTHSPTQDAPLLTNLRQHESITSTLVALNEAVSEVRRGVPHEILLISLQAALDSLNRLTGATTSEDILKLIFSTFCIGK